VHRLQLKGAEPAIHTTSPSPSFPTRRNNFKELNSNLGIVAPFAVLHPCCRLGALRRRQDASASAGSSPPRTCATVTARSCPMDASFSRDLLCIRAPLCLLHLAIDAGLGCLPLVRCCHLLTLLQDYYTMVCIFPSIYYLNMSYSLFDLCGKYPFELARGT
jgi:hypothetical protein